MGRLSTKRLPALTSVFAGLLGLLCMAAGPSLSVPSTPRTPSASLPSPSRGALPQPRLQPEASVFKTSPSVVGLGARLGAQIRTLGLARNYRFVARGLSRAQIESAGGRVTSQIGPILSGVLSGTAIYTLAPSAALIDAPTPLRPLLDVSRTSVRADRADRGEGFASKYRGEGALIGFYDSGIDLRHPDLRALDGPSRVVSLWDQDQENGTPPAGKMDGHECVRSMIEADGCTATDRVGHGTHVISIAASNGPGFRGIAPDSGLLVAKSSNFELFLDTLDWLSNVAATEGLPLVMNLSLGGHEGPHDGTSLESQAIESYEHLVVAAAGNEGELPVHASAELSGTPQDVVLRFPVLSQPQLRRAIVDVWGAEGGALTVQTLVLREDAQLTISSTIKIGDPGISQRLTTQTATLGVVLMDAEAGPNSFNQKNHVRIEVQLTAWEDTPAGPGYIAVRLSGSGRVDLWVDSPASEPAPIRFDQEGVLGGSQILGDTISTISDPATAVSALTVGAYTTRTEFTSEDGNLNRVQGSLGRIADFTSSGPTASSEIPKPDLAAPGLLVIGARSADGPEFDSGAVSKLYRAGAGTSLAAPHVAGAAALILAARPETDKLALREFLLLSASTQDLTEDSRWGLGKLDTEAALILAVGASGCSCRSAKASGGLWALLPGAWILFALWWVRRLA